MYTATTCISINHDGTYGLWAATYGFLITIQILAEYVDPLEVSSTTR